MVCIRPLFIIRSTSEIILLFTRTDLRPGGMLLVLQTMLGFCCGVDGEVLVALKPPFAVVLYLRNLPECFSVSREFHRLRPLVNSRFSL